MLWPLLLPFRITFWLLTALVISVTALAPRLNRKRGNTFLVATSLAMIAFIPSCTGIMLLTDAFRFGKFEYAAFEDVNDFRAERYLPTSATAIKMYKQGNGYRARYSISDTEFHAYLDQLWGQHGESSATTRGEILGEGSTASKEELERVFADLGWEPLQNAIVYYSPTEDDGGGATYYFDSTAGVAMQRTGYW